MTQEKVHSRRAVVVATAGDSVQASIWVDALRAEGIEATSYEQSVGPALGGAVAVFARFPILVAPESLVDARNVIADLDGAEALAPVRDPAEADERRRQALIAVGAIVLVIVVLSLAGRLLG